MRCANKWMVGAALAVALAAPAWAQVAPAPPADDADAVQPAQDWSRDDPLFWNTAPDPVGTVKPTAAKPAAPSVVAPPPAGADDDFSDIAVMPGDIVVTASRLPGEVDAPQKAVATYDEEDIAALGANSITDLLDAISPQTNSGRGRGATMPVILVNGVRISSFREMRDYPPEAIRKVEILPEEVALRYGYPPDQRVVNFILKDNFAARTLEVEGSAPTRGGTATVQGQAGLLKIDGNSRFNLTVKADHTSPLTEAARGVIEAKPGVPAGTVTVAGDPDPAAARTLVAKASDYSANGTWTIGLGQGKGGGSLALNAAVSRAESTSLTGLTNVVLTAPDGTSALRYLPDAAVREGRTDTIQAGAALNKPLGQWQLSATVDGSHASALTQSDTRFATAGLRAAAAAGTLAITGPLPTVGASPRDVARSTTNSVASLVTVNGRPLRLPGGETTLTLKAGFAWTGLDSSDTLSQAKTTQLRRGDASVGANLGVPITSRREGFGAGVGDLALNLSVGLDRLSDFGTLTDWSAGLSWGVTDKLQLQASYIVNQAAPSLGQLGNPVVVTANVPVYDFVTGRTVLVTMTTGGNPNLQRQQQRDIKLGANWTLPFLKNSNLLVEYFHNHSQNVSATFPLLTPAIELAYPGRVTRVNGVITAVDARPVTVADQLESRLRWGMNLGGNLGKPVVGGGRGGLMGGGMGGPPPGGGRGFGGGPGGAGPGGGPGFGGRGGGDRGPRYEGRWNLAIYHTIQFADHGHLAPGSAELDLLNGDALAASGGVARHAIEVEGGGFYKGFGLRLNANWASPTTIHASGAPAAGNLRFGSVTKLNLRLFADLGQQKRLTDASSFFKGARVSLMVNNLLDSHQKVTDGNGQVPISYQPDAIDPLGRVIGLELRKMF
ncbi:MAG: TonB-dependent receptor [Sphingomonadales bacterium]|nr:TonB-dependent receptor [Sphingomonadales bacterium]